MTTATNVDEAPKTASTEDLPNAPVKPGINRKLILIVVLSLAAIATLCYWLNARNYESTDDAQVDGHFAQLSTRITGTVTYMNPKVENDRYVTAGELLIELDPRDYEAALEHAKAMLETKEASAKAAKLQVPITQASAYSQLHLTEAAREQSVEGVAAAEASLESAQAKVQQDEAVAGRAERDRVRYAALVEKREISRSHYDARATEATADSRTLASSRAALKEAEQRVAEAKAIVAQREAAVAGARTAPEQYSDAVAHQSSAQGELDQARADVHTAELNLSYTKIYAPVSGVVGHKTVELGHRIQPGQSLLTVVPLDDIWVTANFKETQLRHMHPGQNVTVHVDTYGRDYQGTVEDMAGASGPLYSLFPPENASGNYVKIVQRFPIRIRINPGQDPEHNLRPGMSLETTVRVKGSDEIRPAVALATHSQVFGQVTTEGKEMHMDIREIQVQRVSAVSTRSFDQVVNGINEKIGHPDMALLGKSILAAQNKSELEQAIQPGIGPTGLMEFARYDLGAILRKENGATAPRILRLVVGNPLIMKEMVKVVPDAGSYAPVTILIDERPDGVHVSYDRMASYLAPYGNSVALKVAQELDAKVESLLTAATH